MCALVKNVRMVSHYPRSEAGGGGGFVPWVFYCVYEWNNERTCSRVQLITTNMQMLLFADEIVMVTEKDDMQRNLHEMKKMMDKWGMKMHWGKRK